MTVTTNESGKTVVEGIDVFVIPNKMSSYKDELSARERNGYKPNLFPWFSGVESTTIAFKDFNTSIPEEEMISFEFETYDYDKEVITGIKQASLPNEYVQLWFADVDRVEKTGDSNFAAHGEYLALPAWSGDKEYRFESNWPAYYFKGKKEGEIVEVEYNNTVFKLRLNQRSYRYARFGKFEDVLTYVLK